MGNMTTLQILQGIKTWVTTKLNLKQDVINDLANIRSGAQAGSTAVQPAELSAYFNDASYDNNTHRINFYHGQTVVAYVDASPFIIDGMVDDVRIENGYLVIDFNAASGKQDISIPLTDIFNPNNYYNKTQTDGLLAQKQDVIQDLADIRSGASAGSTAVQPSTLNNAVKNVVAESGVYDVSANNDNTKFESLSALLSSANLNTLIPTDIRKGGMSIKFVLSSDNKYVQFRYMSSSTAVADFTNVANWQGVDDVKPVKATYEEMTEMRDHGNLIPGQYYQITDYVTTINEAIITNARSAGHPFDILVRADSATVLNEQAWAVRHDGDTYFKDARMEAWELKYRLDNVQWSKQAGTYVTYEDGGYTFMVVGDITLSGHTYKLLQGFGMYVENWSDYALMETVAEGETIYCYYGAPEDFNPEEPEVVGTASGVEEVTESGKGTITWMKDEHGNECTYDFKNVQFKRYMTTDSVSGRDGLGGKYMVADPDNRPQGLSVEDTEDYIWAYTFSSDNAGGEQTDYSLTADHQVHDNVMKAYSGGLNNNVMFGSYIYGNEFEIDCYDNSIGSNMYNNSIGSYFQYNSIGSDIYNNSIGSYFQYNSICSDIYSNSIGSYFQYNSIGSGFSSNRIGSGFQYNSIGSYFLSNSIGSDMYNNSIVLSFTNNSIGSSFHDNSIGSGMYNNSIGSGFSSNRIGSNFQYNTIDEGVQYTTTGDNIKYVHVLNGVAGTSSSKLTLTFAANKTYCQMAAKTTAGALKIWVPADLV